MEVPSDSDILLIIRSFNAFAIDLLKQVGGKGDNCVLSPFNLAMALSMVWIGAKNVTAAEIAQGLHLMVTPQTLSRGALSILNTIAIRDPREKNQLHLANALWIKQGYPVHQKYHDAIRQFYKGDLFEVAFSDPAAACKVINSWVSTQTKTKIPRIIEPNDLNEASNLVLTTAIYFLGEWLIRFHERNTCDRVFYPLTGQEIRVSTMHLESTFGYMEDEDLQYLEMPYEGNNFAMGILLPKKRDGLRLLESKLSVEKLSKLFKFASRQIVNVFLPKFKIEETINFEQILKILGIKTAFIPNQADFAGITSDPAGIFISAVLHKAFVDANEKGTEAAAATAILMSIGGVDRPKPREIHIFRADHPFLFLIRQTEINVILFLGEVVLPRK